MDTLLKSASPQTTPATYQSDLRAVTRCYSQTPRCPKAQQCRQLPRGAAVPRKPLVLVATQRLPCFSKTCGSDSVKSSSGSGDRMRPSASGRLPPESTAREPQAETPSKSDLQGQLNIGRQGDGDRGTNVSSPAVQGGLLFLKPFCRESILWQRLLLWYCMWLVSHNLCASQLSLSAIDSHGPRVSLPISSPHCSSEPSAAAFFAHWRSIAGWLFLLGFLLGPPLDGIHSVTGLQVYEGPAAVYIGGVVHGLPTSLWVSHSQANTLSPDMPVLSRQGIAVHSVHSALCHNCTSWVVY